MEENREVIYDEQGNIIEGDVDLENGEIRLVQHLKEHHEEIQAQDAVYEDQVLEGTENMVLGGLHTIVMVSPAIPHQDAWDEYETRMVYHPFTEEEKEQKNLPTFEERIEAQVLWTAMRTGTLIGTEGN